MGSEAIIVQIPKHNTNWQSSKICGVLIITQQQILKMAEQAKLTMFMEAPLSACIFLV
jgi:hypothetical protein